MPSSTAAVARAPAPFMGASQFAMSPAPTNTTPSSAGAAAGGTAAGGCAGSGGCAETVAAIAKANRNAAIPIDRAARTRKLMDWGLYQRRRRKRRFFAGWTAPSHRWTILEDDRI